jgi:hypothetical protein
MMKKFIFLILLASILISSNVYALELGGRWFVGGGGGTVYPLVPGTYKDSMRDGFSWNAHVGYELMDELSLHLSYADMELEKKTTRLETRFQTLLFGFRYHPFLFKSRYQPI